GSHQLQLWARSDQAWNEWNRQEMFQIVEQQHQTSIAHVFDNASFPTFRANRREIQRLCQPHCEQISIGECGEGDAVCRNTAVEFVNHFLREPGFTHTSWTGEIHQ